MKKNNVCVPETKINNKVNYVHRYNNVKIKVRGYQQREMKKKTIRSG